MRTGVGPVAQACRASPLAPVVTIGSLCSGYGGLDMAVREAIGGGVVWHADPDPGASAILAHHWPLMPNLGDITVVDWAGVPPVDVVAGGYPCQPFSVAGMGKGRADARHIWPHIAAALGVLRPRLVVLENVANHVRVGLGDVLADLARLGFDAEWCCVRASEIGAAHRRDRLFVVAWPAGGTHLLQGLRPGGRVCGEPSGGGDAVADAGHGPEPERAREARWPAGERPPEWDEPGGGGPAAWGPTPVLSTGGPACSVGPSPGQLTIADG